MAVKPNGRKSSFNDETEIAEHIGGRTIEFFKKTVIGCAVESPNGTSDILGLFFDAVQRDSRDQMNPHGTSEDEYEFADRLGKTTIIVKHEPHGNDH